MKKVKSKSKKKNTEGKGLSHVERKRTQTKKNSSEDDLERDEAIPNKEDPETDTQDTSLLENEHSQPEANDNGFISNVTFESLGVCEPICNAIYSLQWKFASKIQKEAIPAALSGRDIIGLAETGSGKTGAFAIPILQSLLQAKRNSGVYAVILAPTRELAFQIHEVFTAIGTAIGAFCVCIVGGVDLTSQSIALAKNPHIITATPGRLCDHLVSTKGFHLRNVSYLVMDEADRMLSMDFEKELNQILDVMPSGNGKDARGGGRRTMLFSATMTSKVQKLQRASLYDPIKVEVSTKFSTPSKLLQHYLFIPAKYKDVYLTYIVNEHAGKSILVFGATCNNVQRLTLMLRNLGFPAVCLHGQMSQPKRLGALNKFKSGGRDILICTDVASRGIDIPNVDLVINFDLPGHGKDYIHRCGRTARAGKSGRAMAMVTQYDVEVYQRLEVLLGKKLPEYKLDEETVLILHERVSDAQRLATRELKEKLVSDKGKGKRRKRGTTHDIDDADGDGGVEEIAHAMMRKGYEGGGKLKKHKNRR